MVSTYYQKENVSVDDYVKEFRAHVGVVETYGGEYGNELDIKPLLLYQDNMSAILLETNGKASSSKRSRHMNIK